MEPHMVSWNHELEQLLADEGEKALGSAWIHNECETYYAKCNQLITIPCIILSTLSGSASVGSQSLFNNVGLASVVIGCISLSVGVLQTLGSFWGFAKLQEAHRNADIQWSKLHRFIAVEMTLPRQERMQARDMLKICRDSIERLSENCPLVPGSVLRAFTKKFGKIYPDVAIPDMANGLRKITINSPPIGLTPRGHELVYSDTWVGDIHHTKVPPLSVHPPVPQPVPPPVPPPVPAVKHLVPIVATLKPSNESVPI